MARCIWLAALALALALWTGAAAIPGSASRGVAGCSSTGYAYAGIMGATAVAGIEATLTAAAAPGVRSGHVAGWVGVGGPGAGPRGANEWLQAGLSSLADGSVRLYYELVGPGITRRYVDLGGVAVGRPVRLAVLEIPTRPSWWRVWVGTRPAGKPIRLVASDHRLLPVATAESWRPSTAAPACNTFAYRFLRVRTVARRGGPFSSFVAAWTLHDAPYTVARRSDGFVARSSGLTDT